MIWRRVAAAAVDGVLFVMAASLASIAIYFASGGIARAFTLMPADHCRTLATLPAEVARAAVRALPGQAHRPIAAAACRRTFLGLESGRFVTVTLQVQQGETVVGASVFQPVDLKGRPIDPVNFDWLYPVAFIALRALSEAAFGGTPGKAALGLRVAGPRGKPGLGRALARNLLVHAWLVFLVLWIVALRHLAPALFPWLLATPVGQANILVLSAPLAALALAALLTGKPEAAYDRWTGVRVVRA